MNKMLIEDEFLLRSKMAAIIGYAEGCLKVAMTSTQDEELKKQIKEDLKELEQMWEELYVKENAS